MSDGVSEVQTWDDLQEVVRAALAYYWPDLPEEIKPHVAEAFDEWVSHARTLAPTYINPKPYGQPE